MLSRSLYCTFPILFIFIFTPTNVSAVTCDYSEKSCYSYSPYYTWCCSTYQYCGDYYTRCLYSPTTTSSPSTIPTTVISVFAIVLLVICTLLITCCFRSQRRPHHACSNTIHSNAQIPAYSYQQQPGRRSARVAPVRPVHNVGAASPIHYMYEEAPPSYEVATRNLPPKPSAAPSAPPPSREPVTIHQAHLRL